MVQACRVQPAEGNTLDMGIRRNHEAHMSTTASSCPRGTPCQPRRRQAQSDEDGAAPLCQAMRFGPRDPVDCERRNLAACGAQAARQPLSTEVSASHAQRCSAGPASEAGEAAYAPRSCDVQARSQESHMHKHINNAVQGSACVAAGRPRASGGSLPLRW